MSQHESPERMAGGRASTSGGSQAPDSNVMARLPDIGAVDRDLDRDLPPQGRSGRLLSSRLAMPLLIGAALVLLAIALAPFLTGKKDTGQIAQFDAWNAESSEASDEAGKEAGGGVAQGSDAPVWGGSASTPAGSASPAAGQPWGATAAPAEHTGHAGTSTWQTSGQAHVVGQPRSAQAPANPQWSSWPAQASQPSGAWSNPAPASPASGPPQPAPWNAGPNPTMAAGASSAQNQGPWTPQTVSAPSSRIEPAVTPTEPVAWNEPNQGMTAGSQVGANPATAQRGASDLHESTHRAAHTSPSYPQSYQWAQAETGTYGGYQAPQAAANRSLAIDGQSSAAVAPYGNGAEQQRSAAWPANQSNPYVTQTSAPSAARSGAYAGGTAGYQVYPKQQTVQSTYPSTGTADVPHTASRMGVEYPSGPSQASRAYVPAPVDTSGQNTSSGNTAYPASGQIEASQHQASGVHQYPTSGTPQYPSGGSTAYPAAGSYQYPAARSPQYPASGRSQFSPTNPSQQPSAAEQSQPQYPATGSYQPYPSSGNNYQYPSSGPYRYPTTGAASGADAAATYDTSGGQTYPAQTTWRPWPTR